MRGDTRYALHSTQLIALLGQTLQRQTDTSKWQVHVFACVRARNNTQVQHTQQVHCTYRNCLASVARTHTCIYYDNVRRHAGNKSTCHRLSLRRFSVHAVALYARVDWHCPDETTSRAARTAHFDLRAANSYARTPITCSALLQALNKAKHTRRKSRATIMSYRNLRVCVRVCVLLLCIQIKFECVELSRVCGPFESFATACV